MTPFHWTDTAACGPQAPGTVRGTGTTGSGNGGEPEGEAGKPTGPLPVNRSTERDNENRRRRRAADRAKAREQYSRWNLNRERTKPRRCRKQRADCHYCGRPVAVTKLGWFHRHYADVGVWCKGSGDAPLGYEVAS